MSIPDLNADELQQLLAILDACYEARKWAVGKSLSEAWRTCDRGDWMLWLCNSVRDMSKFEWEVEGWPTRQQIALACRCALGAAYGNILYSYTYDAAVSEAARLVAHADRDQWRLFMSRSADILRDVLALKFERISAPAATALDGVKEAR